MSYDESVSALSFKFYLSPRISSLFYGYCNEIINTKGNDNNHAMVITELLKNGYITPDLINIMIAYHKPYFEKTFECLGRKLKASPQLITENRLSAGMILIRNASKILSKRKGNWSNTIFNIMSLVIYIL